MAANEFRKDLVSGEWVLISSLRAKRPHEEKRVPLDRSLSACPFEGVTGDKFVAVIKNQFPALQEGACAEPASVGPFQTYEAKGFHELVITRDHDRSFAQFSTEETTGVLQAYRERYRQIAADNCGAYVSIFHNHGRGAGASVYHNHSQIISTPIVPPEVVRSLMGADRYMKEKGQAIHRMMIEWEIQQEKRIVYENDLFVAFCPFVSKAGYEVRIFPKQQNPRFETSTDADLAACAQALNAVLKKLFLALDDVDYNFYIHTAPVQADPAVDISAYHWHLDVVPRIPVAAGFELGTAIYINPFDPDDCARHLQTTEI